MGLEVLNRVQAGAALRRALVALVAAVAFLVTASPASADDLKVDYPANGAILKGSPHDIYGTIDNSLGVFQSITVSYNRQLRDGSVNGLNWTWVMRRRPTLGGSFVNDWSWSEADDEDDFLWVFTEQYFKPTEDGQWRIQAVQPRGTMEPSISHEITFTIDSTPPTTAIESTPPEFSNDTTPEFEFSGTDPDPPDGFGSGVDYFDCRIDGGVWDHCTSPGGSAPYTYEATKPNGDPLDEGNHTLDVRALDKAGNEDLTPASYTWMVDTTPPNITFNVTPKQRFLLHQGAGSASCSDPLSGGPPPVASGVASCGDNGFNNEDLGPHKLSANATDRAGNAAAADVAYVIDPPRYGDFVSDDNPVAYYRHSEPYPSSQTPQEIDMLDSSGNEHHGTYKNNVALGRTGGPTCTRRPHPPRVCELAADPENKAAFFPERDGYGYVNGIPSSPTGYTMEAWIKPRTSGPMMVMSHGRAGQLFIDQNQRLAFEQSQDTVTGSGPSSIITANGTTWTHVAATWDGNNTRLYVNGVQVAHSTTANKTPSGTSTFYVGYGEKAPWFHGEIDESALYDYALDSHRIADRHKIGTAKDNPSVEAGNSPLNTEGPFTDPNAPKNTGLYAPNKTPNADFACTDPDDLPGNSDIASCTATVQKTSPPAGPITTIANGAPLPDALGSYTFTVTGVDESGNTYVHPHTYTVKSFKDIYLTDNPSAYYRLGDGAGATEMTDASPNENHGEYKNGQNSGPVGVAGDGDTAREFFGFGGYGYANGIAAPNYASTLEAWVRPDDLMRDQSIAGHGDGGELFIEGGVFKFRHGSQNRIVSSSPPYAPNPNSTYTQVVGTWDGVDLRIYVNGELEGTLESNRGPSSSSTFYVGFGEIKQWFDGAIDEVAYYPTALNANRVKQHFLADPAADGEGGGGPSGGDSGGGPADPGDTGGGDSGQGGDQGSGEPGAEPPADPSGEDAPKAAELQKCVKRALKISNKKKRHKAVKKCRAELG